LILYIPSLSVVFILTPVQRPCSQYMFPSTVPLELLSGVLSAYNDALDHTYILSIVMGVIACLASCGMKWVSVREKNLLAGGNV
jgi:hypothetical protein